MLAYPDHDTCRMTSPPAGQHHAYQQIAQPMDDPQVRALCRVATDAKVWLGASRLGW